MHLTFNLPSENIPQNLLQIDVNCLIVAGWTGRDVRAVEHHIGELAAIGVPRPSTVPLFYHVAVNQLSQADTVQVVGDNTSGEAEPFLFFQAGEYFVSIASDHTDRTLETHSIALSKQICPSLWRAALGAWSMCSTTGTNWCCARGSMRAGNPACTRKVVWSHYAIQLTF
jgi:hypothetical protein